MEEDDRGSLPGELVLLRSVSVLARIEGVRLSDKTYAEEAGILLRVVEGVEDLFGGSFSAASKAGGTLVRWDAIGRQRGRK